MSGRRDAGRRGSPGNRRRTRGVGVGGIRFSKRELFDLGAAWVTLGLAFAILLLGPRRMVVPDYVVVFLPLSMLTAGIGFLLHELAHKVVAVRFGQLAEFRADYQNLFLALMSALVGFLFAAPGAVYHQGRITPRENGLIALAGPVTNLVLAALFLPLTVVGGPLLSLVGSLGLGINLFLAAFNMVPFGPLDGRKVLNWNRAVFAAVFVPSVALVVYRLFFGGGII